jgi:hypothetical protein
MIAIAATTARTGATTTSRADPSATPDLPLAPLIATRCDERPRSHAHRDENHFQFFVHSNDERRMRLPNDRI